ncbi:MAG: NnrS family protein [Hyphomicrobiaceae bacterium]
MTSTAEQMRAYRGPGILSFGFRPFFFGAAAWAALAVALWLPMLSGSLVLPTAFSPITWHVHELIYGYVPAVMAGFLLTAVPNWTGRLPVVGHRLLFLVLTWIAGRMAVLTSNVIGVGLAGAVDVSFLGLLSGFIAREILSGKDRRNLKVLAMVALLLVGNIVFHLEAAFDRASGFGTRIGIGATVLLIMLIGGRIVPSFTHNWLVKRGTGRLPSPFGRFDEAAMVVSGITLATWAAEPQHRITATLAVVAALVNAGRVGRWAGYRTVAEPLVLILHAAFAFVPIGFALVALGIARPDILAPTGALHAWTAGAIGLMTLAVMTRASLGHTGRPLTATRAIQAIYVAALIAALARILAAFSVLREPMLHLSAIAWVLAFGGFVAAYTPLLMRARR